MSANLRLELQGISKAYPGVQANSDVALRVQQGEIHAVLGENGAGKSTLMKIIYGVTQPDTGSMLFDAQAVSIKHPQQARALGIAMVFQHFSLFETLSVAENVWLGLDERLKLAEVTQRISSKAAEYGLEIDPLRPVHSLSVGERQRVEIIRALLSEPKLLILDEPTSVLTPQAVTKLFETLRLLKSQGCSILYISHKLHEIRELCDSCTVMRGGRVVAHCTPAQETDASLSRMMIGSEPPALEHRQVEVGGEVLAVRSLNLPAQDMFSVALKDVNLHVRSGEVLGIAGVSGNGQRELLAVLSGEDSSAAHESVFIQGEKAGQYNPQRRRQLGLHMVPDERLGRGAVPGMSLASNVLLTRKESLRKGGWIDTRALKAQAQSIISRFDVKAAGTQALAASLSGGNLQKFIVGREIDANPKLLIISQPTWGVDVGAAARIRSEILSLRDKGCAVLVISEEIDELFELADRLQVIYKGELSPSMHRAEASLEKVGLWMSGLWKQEAAYATA
jgi:general nucleoside transport system ATP-binding protein